jgi:carboxyl-terminal processing protease
MHLTINRLYKINLGLLCLLCISISWLYSENTNPDAEQIIAKISSTQGTDYWVQVNRLEQLGVKGLPVIEKGLTNSVVSVRIACAYATYHLGHKQDGINTLLQIVQKDTNLNNQRFASEVIAQLVKNDNDYGNKNQLVQQLQSLTNNQSDDYIKLNLTKTRYEISGDINAIHELETLLKTNDLILKHKVALALGELDHTELANDILKELSLELTEQGYLASMYLRYKQLQDTDNKPANKPPSDYALLDEVLTLIRDNYVDPEKFDLKTLLENAAKGLASELDRFSGYEDATVKKSWIEHMAQKYGGIGAHVNIRNDYLTIERPIYSGPAYKAGLRALDKITEVEGESTKGKDMAYLVSKLKGDPNTPVKIKVARHGWPVERDFSIIREVILAKSAQAEILPGNIGYILITSFTNETAKDMKECLQKLKNKAMQALIIDLRNNPGGSLQTVVEIVDMFFEKNKIVTSLRDRNGKVVQEFHTRDDERIDCPICVLVNGNSASGSELLSGVLQDYKKAILIGQRTFGKGCGQNTFDLNATNKQTALRLTTFKYYLPSGRCIHKGQETAEGGVQPDIELTTPPLDPWKDYEFNKLLDSEELDNYLDAEYPLNKNLFQTLADDDGMDSKRYPHFSGLYQRLKAYLDETQVREVLREHIRRRIADERGEEFLADIQHDLYIQRAVIEDLKGLKINPETIPSYSWFAHKFDQKEKPTTTPVK